MKGRAAISRILLVLAIVVIIAVSAISAYALVENQNNTTSSHSTSEKLYPLSFVQLGACSPAVFAAPWGVVLNNKTISVEPTNATEVHSEMSNGGKASTVYGGASPQYKNYSTISFSVTEGIYTYSIGGNPFLGLSGPQTGIVNVTSGGTTIIATVEVACTTNVNTSSSTP